MNNVGGSNNYGHISTKALEYFQNLGCKTMLDIGCGVGLNVSYASEVLGYDAWGIEGDPDCKPIVENAYRERDSEMLSAQWQACLEYSALEELPNCKRPIHVIAFDQDMQTPPARGKIVSDAAADGHFHLLNGLGHCSLFRHKPKVVADKIREIISIYK